MKYNPKEYQEKLVNKYGKPLLDLLCTDFRELFPVRKHQQIPDKILLFRNKADVSGVVVYSLYEGVWHKGEGERFLVSLLFCARWMEALRLQKQRRENE